MASEIVRNCKIHRMNSTIPERLDTEGAVAAAAQLKSDMDFLSMMTGIDLDQDDEEEDEDE